MDFQHKRVIITGASSGIGAELARQLAAQNTRLVLAARRVDRLEEVAQSCRSLGSEVHLVPTDVADPEQCKAMVEQAVNAWGGIDVLIANAGVTMQVLFEDITDISLFEKIMRINYLGSVYCTYYALPHLKESQGAIVAVSSLTGKAGIPTRTAYSASKHAMHGFFDSLRVELMGSGIQITIVCPGFVESEVRYSALMGDGSQSGFDPQADAPNTMSTAECAQIIISAAEKGKREEVMTTRGKLGRYLRLLMPNAIDKMTRRAMGLDQGRSHHEPPPAR